MLLLGGCCGWGCGYALGLALRGPFLDRDGALVEGVRGGPSKNQSKENKTCKTTQIKTVSYSWLVEHRLKMEGVQVGLGLAAWPLPWEEEVMSPRT